MEYVIRAVQSVRCLDPQTGGVVTLGLYVHYNINVALPICHHYNVTVVLWHENPVRVYVFQKSSSFFRPS
jgi:hypothetical protein